MAPRSPDALPQRRLDAAEAYRTPARAAPSEAEVVVHDRQERQAVRGRGDVDGRPTNRMSSSHWRVHRSPTADAPRDGADEEAGEARDDHEAEQRSSPFLGGLERR